MINNIGSSYAEDETPHPFVRGQGPPLDVDMIATDEAVAAGWLPPSAACVCRVSARMDDPTSSVIVQTETVTHELTYGS